MMNIKVDKSLAFPLDVRRYNLIAHRNLQVRWIFSIKNCIYLLQGLHEIDQHFRK